MSASAHHHHRRCGSESTRTPAPVGRHDHRIGMCDVTAVSQQRSIEARLDELESRNAIAELSAKYAHGIDGKNDDIFLPIWHEDALFNIGGEFGRFAGRENMLAAMRSIEKAWEQTHHWITNLVVEFQDSDHATGRADTTCTCIDHDGVYVMVSAIYDDRYERRDGLWRFAVRDLIVHYRWSTETQDYGWEA
jgi:gamma-hexachlorocyclohexane dehydrochlorinase